MDDCPFCAVASGDRDAHVLYEDDATVAFLDENPATEGHALVVPRTHVEDVLLADGATATAVFETARTVATAMDAALSLDGFSVFHTTGGLVGSVDHAHVHLLPRRAGDGVSLALDRTSLAAQNPEETVQRVRAELGDGDSTE